MNTICLLTAAFRIDNLIPIAHSIVDGFKTSQQLKPLWVIIIDQYNAVYSPSKLEEVQLFCKDNNIDYLIEYGGVNKDKPNYGGDIYNETIFKLKATMFSDSNPLVYILDDDNLIHPLFVPTIEKTDLTKPGIIWLSCMRQRGVICEAEKTYAWRKLMMNEEEYVIPMQWVGDPSQMVFRMDYIIKMNGFHHASNYDYVTLSKMYEKFGNDYVFYDTYDGWHHNRTHTYHNGLRSVQDTENYINKLESDEPTEAHLYVQGANSDPEIFPVSSKLAKIILVLIQEELKQNQMSK